MQILMAPVETYSTSFLFVSLQRFLMETLFVQNSVPFIKVMA